MSNRLNGLHKQELASHSPNNHVYKYKKNFRFYPKVQKFGTDGGESAAVKGLRPLRSAAINFSIPEFPSWMPVLSV